MNKIWHFPSTLKPACLFFLINVPGTWTAVQVIQESKDLKTHVEESINFYILNVPFKANKKYSWSVACLWSYCNWAVWTTRLNPGPFSVRDHSLVPGGGPRQIQDSQRGGINKSAHKEGEGLPDFLFLFYFQTNTFSALGTNGTWFARLLWRPKR